MKCIVCGKEFEAAHGNRRICSATCRALNRSLKRSARNVVRHSRRRASSKNFARENVGGRFSPLNAFTSAPVPFAVRHSRRIRLQPNTVRGRAKANLTISVKPIIAPSRLSRKPVSIAAKNSTLPILGKNIAR